MPSSDLLSALKADYPELLRRVDPFGEPVVEVARASGITARASIFRM